MVKKPEKEIILRGTAPHKEPDYMKKRRKNNLWCCYCGEWRRFKMGIGGSSYKRCEVCEISTEDFWIKKANGLWDVKGR